MLKISQFSTFGGHTQAEYQTFISLISLKAQINAYHTVFLVSAGIVLVGAFMAIMIGDVKMDPKVHVHVE